MNTATLTDSREQASGSSQVVTFLVGDMKLGVCIEEVQEINRNLECAQVPHAPTIVRGVINLRGNVVTVIDMRTLFDLPPGTLTGQSRNLIVRFGDELVGLWVDQILDTIVVPADAIEPTPANLSGVSDRFFRGVYSAEADVTLLLQLSELLSSGHVAAAN
jgi:purine-binding chemotaxis protein CheW